MSKSDYIIGTRGSLLAVTQSTLVKNLLEEKTGKKFEIKTIQTQGDVQTDKPLWQMDGKDFFTKELDSALLNKEIDLVIHSYKDLGSERPEGITLAAITERTFSHDILLIKNETIPHISDIKEFIVGTSSPRRIQNIESSLKEFLPNSNNLSIKCETLRGNVNTRIQKLLDDKYHAIILAFAGLERLCMLESSKKELQQLVQNLNFMVLPQSEFTSAASQGALALECNSENKELEKLIRSSVHDNKTAETVGVERAEFQRYGGGCHLAVGVHCHKLADEFILYQKGIADNKFINSKEIQGKNIEDILKSHKEEKVFLGLPKYKIQTPQENFVYDELIKKEGIDFPPSKGCFFITSSYSAEHFSEKNEGLIFSSGNHTWKKLSRKGFWVNGSADSIGHEQIERFQKSELIKLFSKDLKWKVLSHKASKSTAGEVIPSYKRVVLSPNKDFIQRLCKCKVFYWTSYYQYETYRPFIESLEDVIHCCGLGKTLEEFQQNAIEVTPIVDMKKWQSLFK